MTLHVHRAERADALVSALADLLARPPADPFAREVVAVPTRGMERWLAQRVSDRLGVCANVDFPSPGRLVREALAAASGIERDADPWVPERAVWPLLETVDAALAEPWLGALAKHVERGNEARRFTAVRHVADLFDRYATHRPDTVRAWVGGADDGWQAELWRRLRARIAAPSPAERLDPACARLRERANLADLPERFAVFGLTRMPASTVAVLRALAASRDVHLFVLHPSPVLWERVAAAPPAAGPRRLEDATAGLPRHPLLASWGHDARELQLVIGAAADHHHPVAGGAVTRLARLQDDIRADRTPVPQPVAGAAGTAGVPPADGAAEAADRSIQVHGCHGRARQVEVLRDAILHLLADDPTLEPRDVIVMCPDIETFAPLIQATFGAAEEDRDGPDLRVRLADRSLRQTNPVLGVVARLLELAQERLTASQVLDLAGREPVRRRFGLDDDDLSRIEEWIGDSGIRWGLDAAQRAPFKLDALAAGTWRAGLDRLLLGVTMTEDEQRLYRGVLPLDDVDSGAIDLAGRFAELIDRLGASLEALQAAGPVDTLAGALAAAADALTETAPRDAWQRAELTRLLDDVVAEAAGHETVLRLPELRALLADRLRGRPTRANFRTGHLTICTLVPMRSVPHRVVCLLGLDDGVFPRKAPRDGDDLMLADPRIGERDPRTEDRQQLLDALMAARDHLIVTYTGRDERTNLARPPAVPVGELLDVVGRDVVTHHPLQPFDARNFAPGAIVSDRVWSFDATTLDGARALQGERAPRRPFLAGPLPPPTGDLVELDDLLAFARRPVRAFLRRRLGIAAGDFADEPADALAVELDGLGRWQVGQRLLDARLAGAERRPAILAEIARGLLPPGILGKPVIDAIAPVVDEIMERVDPAPADSVDVRVRLPGGRLLTGTVPGVAGDTLRTVTYSKLNARHRLVAWVQLLALSAAHPGRPFEARTVGRESGARVGPLDAGVAADHLEVLLDLYDRGLREPPPLACRTSAAYATAARAGGDARVAARDAWESDHAIDREDRDPEHRLVLGGVVPFAALLGPARPDEHGPWWDADETTRFGRWARRLWDPLLQVEEVDDR